MSDRDVYSDNFHAFETFNVHFGRRHGFNHRFWRVEYWGPNNVEPIPVRVFLQNKDEAIHFVKTAEARNYQPQ